MKSRRTSAVNKNSLLEPLVHLWLAGLGAASRSQTKGPQWLQDLIREGARLEAFERKAARKAVRSTLGSVQAVVRRVVDELPPVQVLKEVRALRKQVDAMNEKLDKLARERGAVRKSRVAKSARRTG
jgi:aminoglycoside phosphotransferase family enzyme